MAGNSHPAFAVEAANADSLMEVTYLWVHLLMIVKLDGLTIFAVCALVRLLRKR